MAVAGEVKVTAGAGATLRSMIGSPREFVALDDAREVAMEAVLWDGRMLP